MEFARRFTSSNNEAPFATETQGARQQDDLLRVDTRPPKSPSASPAGSPVPSGEPRSSPSSLTPREDVPRRRRSHSECLLLAKQQGTQDLPGPCQEYITNVKQILAKNDEFQMTLKRRRSMNLSHPSLFKQ